MRLLNAFNEGHGVPTASAALWRRHSILALTLAAAGCRDLPLEPGFQDGPPPGPIAGESRPARESAMNQQWRNRGYSELIAAMGDPVLVMNIPGGGNPAGFVAVYGHDKVSGCVDAFAMVYGRDPAIRVYHCR